MRLPGAPGRLHTPSETQDADHEKKQGGAPRQGQTVLASTAAIARTPTKTEANSRVRVRRQIEPQEFLL